jgi:hypothetical protein
MESRPLDDDTLLRLLSLFPNSKGIDFAKLDTRFFDLYINNNHLCGFDKYEPELYMEQLWELGFVKAIFAIDESFAKDYKYINDDTVYSLTFKGLWKRYAMTSKNG